MTVWHILIRLYIKAILGVSIFDPKCDSPQNHLKRFQRGDTEAQNGYGFCMLLGQVALTGTFQAQL